MRSRSSSAALAATVIAVALLASCSSFRPYAAEVNGERISQDDLQRELDAILDNKEYLEQQDRRFAAQFGEPARGAGKDTFNTVFVAALLDRQIAFELIHQELRRRKLTVPPEVRREVRQNLVRANTERVFNAFPKSYQDDLVRVFSEVMTLERALTTTAVDDDDVRRFYDENPAAFAQTCVRHILVDGQEKATSVKARIDAGEDFAAIARAESTDNQGPEGGSAAKGGDLGCVTQGSLVPEFETAMAELQPGQVSAPVQSQFGFHVIQVLERKTQSLEEAAPRIREALQSEAPAPVQAFLNRALSTAKIKVNPRYGRFVREGPNAGVQAPKLLAEPAPEAPPLPQPSQ